MKIPRSFSVACKTYKVSYTTKFSKPGQVGRVVYDDGMIVLAHKYNLTGELRSPAQLYHTFWHETVHAVLDSMGHTALRNDEKFVDRLAERLVQVFTTARF